MRVVVFLLAMMASYSVSAARFGEVELVLPPGAELVEESSSDEAASHMVPLGSLEKINRELEPEAYEFVIGTKHTMTWHLPQSRRTTNVSRDLENQLAGLEQVFTCKGRGCGSSSYWANRIFKEAILYGPEQFQYYQAYRFSGTNDYLLVYVSERATRKIYLHIEHIQG